MFADIRNFQKHWFVIVQELLWQWGNFGWKYNNPKLLLKEETYRFGVTVLLEKEVVEFYMRYCNNTEKTKQLIAGIVIYMGVNLLMYCNEIIIAIDNGKAFLKTSDFPILIIGIIVNFGPAILYLVGARRNRPAGEQIEVESR